MIGLLITILVGAVSGWLASILMKKENSFSMSTAIIYGIVGSMIGNMIARALGLYVSSRLSIGGLIFSVLGSCIVIYIADWIDR